MKLHIANCTRQTHHFNYKLPERMQTFTRDIAPGEQIVIDGSADDIHLIISQHAPYGFAEAAKIPDAFSGLCYSLDKAIHLNKIKSGYEVRTEFLEDQAQRIRDNSVLTLNNALSTVAKNHGKEALPGLEVTIESQPLDPLQEDVKKLKETRKVEK